MHIVERYRLIDGAVAKAQIDKYETSEGTVGAGARDAGYNPDTSLKGLQLEVTMEDPKVFTAPLTARVTYRRVTTEWQEQSASRTRQNITRVSGSACPGRTIRISE
jgi:prolyl-tRNA editing enzyme YbaK/EbsC (Cys-tRNA(Pro) deacylase)